MAIARCPNGLLFFHLLFSRPEGDAVHKALPEVCPKRLHKVPTDKRKAPTDNTKPQQTIRSPNRQYKAPTDNTKHRHIRQDLKILDKDTKY